MSNDLIADSPEVYSGTLLHLLKEYTEKIQTWIARARTIISMYHTADGSVRTILKDEVDALLTKWKKVQPVALDLTRQVSGMIDQGAITPSESIALRIRLAEFEGSYEEFTNLTLKHTVHMK